MSAEVRCPYCNKKLAERLNGKVEFICRDCEHNRIGYGYMDGKIMI